MKEKKCPCHSKELYELCCKPFHDGQIPHNALLLVRSRYSAYVLNLPEYIVATTHPASKKYSPNLFSWKRSISQFSQSCDFLDLKILDFEEGVLYARVIFTAYIRQGDADRSFTETSYFEKLHGRWLYREGHIAPEGTSQEAVLVEPVRLLPMAYYEEPVLRKKARPIDQITEEIELLAERMVETTDALGGVGIAAPQVHESLRLFVTRVPKEGNRSHMELGEVQVFVNPVISSPSGQTWSAPESCMSIPWVRGDVIRPNEITVEYIDLEGREHKKQFSGWEAKVILHENDHIEGILFIDHLPESERTQLEAMLEHARKWIHEGS